MPKRYPEMIDVMLLVDDAKSTDEETFFCIDNFFGFQQKPEEAERLIEEGVRGIHLTAIDTVEEQRVLNVINDSGKFTVEREEILPEDREYIALVCIKAVHTGSVNLVDRLIDLMNISNSLCIDLKRHIPGF